MATKVEVNTGVPFATLLALLFIGLKLTNYIDWSWLWVLSPLWLPLAILILFFVGYIAFMGLMMLFVLFFSKK